MGNENWSVTETTTTAALAVTAEAAGAAEAEAGEPRTVPTGRCGAADGRRV